MDWCDACKGQKGTLSTIIHKKSPKLGATRPRPQSKLESPSHLKGSCLLSVTLSCHFAHTDNCLCEQERAFCEPLQALRLYLRGWDSGRRGSHRIHREFVGGRHERVKRVSPGSRPGDLMGKNYSVLLGKKESLEIG